MIKTYIYNENVIWRLPIYVNTYKNQRINLHATKIIPNNTRYVIHVAGSTHNTIKIRSSPWAGSEFYNFLIAFSFLRLW